MAVWARSGKEPAALADRPRLPEGLDPLWRDFSELHDSRGSNGFGPMRITFGDIHAWQAVKGVTLEAWEVEAVRRADNAFLASYAAQSKGREHG